MANKANGDSQRLSEASGNLRLLRVSRPRFIDAAKSVYRNSKVLGASPFIALVLALLAWLVPNPEVRAWLHWIIAAAFAALLGITGVVWLVMYICYVRKLQVALDQIRSVWLASAGLKGPGPTGDFTYGISGIAEDRGSVVLVLDRETSDCVTEGTQMLLVADPTLEVWGTVQVSTFSDGRARARIKDRKKPEFWEQLEDRMGKDPSPPKGFHLEPLALRAILNKQQQ